MSDRLTKEQQHAVDCVIRGCNVRVRAVPGAGKTHTLIALAPKLESVGLRVLQLTYSSALKMEWQERRGDQRGLRNPQSFHSFACVIALVCNLPCGTPKDDDSLRNMLDLPPPTLPREWVADVIIIDEMQDMCPLFARLLRWYTAACHRRFQMVVVGQEDQIVYECLGEDKKADLRYFLRDDEFADILSTPEWVECRFTMSFRLTPAHAYAVNAVFGTSIVGCNTTNANRKPRLVVCDTFDTYHIARYIERLIKKYGNVMIVSPSKKENSKGPAMRVRNMLSSWGYMFTDSEDTEDVRRNKIVCYTCHGVKGMETVCTIVVGGDDFSSWVNRPAIFVAYTRAREQLVIFQHYRQRTWILEGAPREYAARGFEVEYMKQYVPSTPSKPMPRFVTVTDLLRSDSVLTQFMRDTPCYTEPPQNMLELPETIDFDDHSENLPRILGIVIPFWYAVRHHTTAPLFSRIFDPIIVNTKDKGQQAINEVNYIMNRNGDEFPDRRKFERSLVVSSDTALVEAIQTHLVSHGHEKYTSRVISQKEYDMKFPSKMRYRLSKLRDTACTTWKPEDVALAALASDAFDGNHCTLHQVIHYDWMSEEFATHCHAHMRDLCDTTAAFEVTVQCCFETPQTYKDSLYPVLGLRARVDCVVGNTIYEFKLAMELTTSHRLQLFLNMCIWLTEHADVGEVTGILLNVRTGERLRMRLTDVERARTVVRESVALHFGEDIDV